MVGGNGLEGGRLSSYQMDAWPGGATAGHLGQCLEYESNLC